MGVPPSPKEGTEKLRYQSLIQCTIFIALVATPWLLS